MLRWVSALLTFLCVPPASALSECDILICRVSGIKWRTPTIPAFAALQVCACFLPISARPCLTESGTIQKYRITLHQVSLWCLPTSTAAVALALRAPPIKTHSTLQNTGFAT